jgi:phthiocerol/phenolphthiocerol synthesis type-I polyketide synthase E
MGARRDGQVARGGRRIGLPGYPFQPPDYAFEPAAPAGVRDGQPTLQEPLVTPETPAATNSDAKRYPRPRLATAYRPAGNEVETKVVALVEEMLSTSGIGVDDDFFELGWDSLLATSLASRLSLDLDLDVDESMVFDAPTAALLAIALASLQSRGNRGR